VVEVHGGTKAGDGGTRSNEMTNLYQDPWFTFRFADDRIIPRFHLEFQNQGIGSALVRRGLSAFRLPNRWRLSYPVDIRQAGLAKEEISR
jgi:hypothetical protein